MMAMTISLVLGWGITVEAAPSVLAKMRAAYERLETLEAELTQVNSYPQLGLSDPPEEGVLQVEREGKKTNVRLEMTVPEQRILVVKDGAFTLYQPRIKQAIVGRAGESQGSRASFLKYLLGDVSGAEDDFHVETLDESVEIAGRETTHLRLVPHTGADSYYSSIELWVDEELGLPIQEKLVEPNRDEVLIRLDEIQINEPADDFSFEIDLPADVERVEG